MDGEDPFGHSLESDARCCHPRLLLIRMVIIVAGVIAAFPYIRTIEHYSSEDFAATKPTTAINQFNQSHVFIIENDTLIETAQAENVISMSNAGLVKHFDKNMIVDDKSARKVYHRDSIGSNIQHLSSIQPFSNDQDLKFLGHSESYPRDAG